MSAPWIVTGAVALLVAAIFTGRALRRFWRHTGQRVNRLADLDRDDMDPRWLRPPPPGWPAHMEWPPPK